MQSIRHLCPSFSFLFNSSQQAVPVITSHRIADSSLHPSISVTSRINSPCCHIYISQYRQIGNSLSTYCFKFVVRLVSSAPYFSLTHDAPLFCCWFCSTPSFQTSSNSHFFVWKIIVAHCRSYSRFIYNLIFYKTNKKSLYILFLNVIRWLCGSYLVFTLTPLWKKINNEKFTRR